MAKLLFIGGTGSISFSCVERARQLDHDVYVFNRGQSVTELPNSVTQLVGDLKDDEVYAELGRQHWDAVVQVMAFMPSQIQRDLRVFEGNTEHYVFVSSASVYEKTPFSYVITEATPTTNPYWHYSQEKIACEAVLKKSAGVPWTIVRPSHTVRTWLPTLFGEDLLSRIRAGKSLLVPGDGNAPWTLTRSQDFAVPFVALLGNSKAYGEDFHITGDVGFTWDAIYRTIAQGIGKEAKIAHVATDKIVAIAPEFRGPLLGDKAWTTLFDNSKVKAAAGEFTCETSLEEILRGPIEWSNTAKPAPGSDAIQIDNTIDRVLAQL